jgi:hypothetical protein
MLTNKGHWKPESAMISDLFEDLICRFCGDSNFERLETLSHERSTDFICICRFCDILFVTVFERQGV